MVEGWIKLYRCLLDKAIWQSSTPEQKVVLITLLLMANHEENEWEWQKERFVCQPGQFITSLQTIARKAGVSIQNVRSSLKKFEKFEFLTNESTKTGRLITIVNWQLYQANEGIPNKEANKALTKHQQSTNKALTTNKNERMKECKNERNNIERDTSSPSTTFKKPTLEEVKAYCLERKNNVDPQKWYDFYEAKGWMIGKNKMKDWKAAVRTWEQRDEKPAQTLKTWTEKKEEEFQRAKRIAFEQLKKEGVIPNET